MIDNETFKQVYSSASTAQKFLFASSKSGEKLFSFAKKHNLTSTEAYSKFAITVGDIILGFYKIEDTVPLLQQELGIDAKTAALLGADVLDFLAPLSDPNFVVPVEVTEVDKMPEIASTDIPATWTPIINNSEPDVSTVSPAGNMTPEIHTMASDANVARTHFEPTTEQMYSSEQPVIRKNLSDTPSYATPFDQTPRDTMPKAPIEPPRWGS